MRIQACKGISSLIFIGFSEWQVPKNLYCLIWGLCDYTLRNYLFGLDRWFPLLFLNKTVETGLSET